jgi:hypothetical protein
MLTPHSCSWLLLRQFAQQVPPLSAPSHPHIDEDHSTGTEIDIFPAPSPDDEDQSAIESGDPGDIMANIPDEIERVQKEESGVIQDLHSPRVSYDDARRIMTRADFLADLDHHNVGHMRWRGWLLMMHRLFL